MSNEKQLGIWMDHASAEFIHFDKDSEINTIDSNFTYIAKEATLSRSENIMHNKEQQMNAAYYKKIADKILNYDHVLLFGPTDAKTELHNSFSDDLHFKDIKIDVEPADKMTDNEKHAYVRNHFEN